MMDKDTSYDAGVTTPIFRHTPKDSVTAERLVTAMSLLSGWVWETDPKHRFTFMSEGVEAFTGRPASWHYGRTRDEIGNKCDPNQYHEFIRKLEAHEPFSAIEFTRVDGDELIHMRAAGAPYFQNEMFCGYRGLAYRIGEEISQRREAQREKAEIMSSFETVIAHYPFAIIVFDRNSQVLFANKKYYDFLGLKKAELRAGSTLREVVAMLVSRGELRGGTAEDIASRHIDLAATGKIFTFERSRANGQILKVQGFPLPCGGSARTFVDVTDRAEDKWLIASLKEKLQQFTRWKT